MGPKGLAFGCVLATLLTVTFAYSGTSVKVNEVLQVPVNPDTAQFIELLNVGTVDESLSGFSVALMNYSTSPPSAYKLVAFPTGATIAAGKYYVLCAPSYNSSKCDAVSSGLGTASGAGAVSISRCPNGADTGDASVDFAVQAGPPSPGAANPCAFAPASFQLIHFNDVHSRIEPSDASMVLSCSPLGNGTGTAACAGGFARMKTLIDQARAAGPTLVIDGGDEFVGTLYSYYYRGLEAYTFQNMMGIDFMTFGNHEFDYGPTTTANYVKNLTAKMVTCNVVPGPTNPLYGVVTPGPATKTIDLGDTRTLKVGIVGWTNTDTAFTSSPGSDIQFLDLVSSVQSCVDTLTAQGVKFIIGIGHAGAYYPGGDFEVAANVTGLDLVVGAHSHTMFFNPTAYSGVGLSSDFPAAGPYPTFIPLTSGAGSVPYVQDYWSGKYLGLLNVTVDLATGTLISAVGNPVYLNGSIPADQTVIAKSMELGGPGSPLESFKNVVVGSSSVYLNQSTGSSRWVRRTETNIGNHITDAMLWEVATNLPAFVSTNGPVKIAMMNGGGIRTNIPAGNITVNQVVTVLPFGNVIGVKRLSGWALWETAKWATYQYPENGRFAQWAGVHFVFNSSGTCGTLGSYCLVGIWLMDPATKCLTAIPNDNSTFYNVVMNDFTARGGDGYAAIAASQMLLATGRVLSDVWADYIKLNSPISPGYEGRIKDVATLPGYAAPVPCSAAAADCFITPTTQGCVYPQFQLVHFNDIHSRIEPSDASMVLSCSPLGNGTGTAACAGGFARIKTLVDAARASGPTLVIDAGDEFVGTLYSYFYRGTEAYTFQNMIGVDFMTFGNHEFDYGPTTTANYVKNLTAKMVTCNVVPGPTNPLYGVVTPGPKTIDLDLGKGRTLKVGVVGWTNTDTAFTSSPGSDIQFLDLVPSVQSCVDTLTAQGVKFIIGIGHAGAYYPGGDFEVAANVTGLDLVVGAHSHTMFFNPTAYSGVGLSSDFPAAGPYPTLIPLTSGAGSVPYVQDYWSGKYLGLLNVTVDLVAGKLLGAVGNPVYLNGSIPANQAVVAKSMELGGPGSPLEGFKNVVVGSTSVYLNQSTGSSRWVRRQETNIGNHITDAMLWEVATNLPAFVSTNGPVKIAMMNGGGIRANIPAGNITVNQVVTVLPFGNVIGVKRLSGWALWETAKWATYQYPENGRFAQWAGVHVVFNSSGTCGTLDSYCLVGIWLVDPVTKCLTAIPNDNSTFYNVVMNDFTARGGDGYAAIAASQMLLATGRVLSDVWADYINLNSPISPGYEGRIKDAAKLPSYSAVEICGPAATSCLLTPTTQGCVYPSPPPPPPSPPPPSPPPPSPPPPPPPSPPPPSPPPPPPPSPPPPSPPPSSPPPRSPPPPKSPPPSPKSPPPPRPPPKSPPPPRSPPPPSPCATNPCNNATCTARSKTAFTCTCNQVGYQKLNATTCLDICDWPRPVCGPNSKCVNSYQLSPAGKTYNCSCNTGYVATIVNAFGIVARCKAV